MSPRKNLRHRAPTLSGQNRTISNRYDQAIAMVASGFSQKKTAEALGCSESRLSKLLNTEEGQLRLDFWIRREIKALLPKSVSTLGRVMDSGNAIASVRAAEAVLDRAGHDKDGALEANIGELKVYLDIFPQKDQ